MRSVLRSPAVVPTLDDPAGAGRRKAVALVQAHENDQPMPTIVDHWNRSDVRGLLYAQQGQVCAYCGSRLPFNDRGDVEHFRPKSSVREAPDHGGYWWLAYDADNYILSCRVCNSNRKSNRFPLRANATRRATFRGVTSVGQEARLLPDPTHDNLELLVTYDWHDELCMVEAAADLTPRERQQARALVEFFKLNSDSRLVGERMEIRDAALARLDAGNLDDVQTMALKYQPHSLLVLQILRDTGNPPAAPDQELRFLVGRLLDQLRRNLALVAAGIDEEDVQRDVGELSWALAVLTEHTPVNGVDVEAILAQLNVLPLISPLRLQV